MEEQLKGYLKGLDIAGTLADKVISLFRQCQSLTNNGVEEVFISETKNQDGTRQYLGLYCFSEGSVLEVPNFVTQQVIEIAKLSEVASLTYANDEITFPGGAIPRLIVTGRWRSRDFIINLVATDTNCPRLEGLLKKYLLPLVVRPAEVVPRP